MVNLDTMLKEEMIKTIEELNPDNIEFQRNRINRLLHLYEETNELFPKEKLKFSVLPISKNKLITNFVGKHLDHVEYIEHLNKERKIIIGHLERNLLGGSIKVADVNIFVPEKVIREFNFKHGDFINANYSNSNKVIFNKVGDSKTEHLCKRKVVQYAVVTDEFLDGELVANQAYVNGKKTYIRIDETPFTFVITDYEKQKFNLLPGDLIEIAYFKDYLQTYKVVWKYNAYEISHLQHNKKLISN